ncbi:ECF RNA polymerase sigma factor SigK [Streptomyces clavuligerus]|uniref:RNA polymerase sigma factor SigK n=1 Tax=Streptomyces clavuligerus TaxID=1901 RepID=B5GM26_STRCL|nr:ECF RNA polymerase sigma factor SigK [Streptomyces clavuligerus]EDY47372.1 RNA polymerase sigma factor SigK [Streptomyces clavuligerus]EFG05027.1 RNA polymerase sigma factor SigK [Streptomyces clavuligerus]MBY6306560.1 ECF RNA polymerase sigma factor SigK [Streptomyces clavuligerus]QCS10834.1 RNA polymerase subunit sigma [Streptomyces clavuligerus]QPJ97128.1 sigma-70 family RNA polymerase sigma factor [Streptomyces clavuligerus]
MNRPLPTTATGHTGTGDLAVLMRQTAQGDKEAFAALYDALAPLVFGIVVKVVRDRAQSEEVAQEVMIDLWRRAAHYRPDSGTVTTWTATIAHRRAVDRVRSAQAAADRERAQAAREHRTAFDDVAEQVETRLDSEQVRRCLRGLTELQHQAVTLAYYRGLTYREVAETLRTPLPTIKTRMRDGLIRLRDCMGVTT